MARESVIQFLLDIRFENDEIFIRDAQGGIGIRYDDAIDIRDRFNQYLKRGKKDIDRQVELDYLRVLERPRLDKAARKRKAWPGHVYLIECNGLHKIGHTANLKARLSSMQSGSSTKLNLICSIKTPEMEFLEYELHERFADRRMAREWFNLTSADVEYIKGLAS